MKEQVHDVNHDEVSKIARLIQGTVERLENVTQNAQTAYRKVKSANETEKKELTNELMRLQTYCWRLQDSARELDRYVSQVIEHGSIEPLTRIELKLRLAELEFSMEAAQQAVLAS